MTAAPRLLEVIFPFVYNQTVFYYLHWPVHRLEEHAEYQNANSKGMSTSSGNLVSALLSICCTTAQHSYATDDMVNLQNSFSEAKGSG